MKRSKTSNPKPTAKAGPTKAQNVEKQSRKASGRSFKFEAIGTVWHIELFSGATESETKGLERKVLKRIDDFDLDYSRFRADSLVAQMARQSGTYALPTDAQALLDLYRKLYGLTDGQVTPLIGQTLSAAGYDADYSLRAGAVAKPPAWDEAIQYNFPSLTVRQPVILDFGAAGKGYLVDIVSKLLEDNGIGGYCVNAGGDIRYQTDKSLHGPLQIALEHPADPTQAIGVATLHNQSICGSSGNRRVWEGYHHIINPTTLQSPRHIAAIWVVADDTITADGLSTALFFVPPSRLLTDFEFEYAILLEDYSLQRSAGFPADFFIR